MRAIPGAQLERKEGPDWRGFFLCVWGGNANESAYVGLRADEKSGEVTLLLAPRFIFRAVDCFYYRAPRRRARP